MQALNTLIDNNQVTYERGLVGCCMRYYVKFPNNNEKYYYKRGGLISKKLQNKISTYLYNMAPKPKTDKTKAAKKIQKAVKAKQKKKNEAAIKIQRGIQGTAKLIVDETVEAMDGKVKEVKVKSSFMGKKVDNLEYVMFKAFQLAKKEVKAKKDNYEVYGSSSFEAETGQGLEKFNVQSKKFNKKEEAHMYGHLRERIYSVIQSDAKINLSTIRFNFNFITIPTGSGPTHATVSRERENILKKTSVNSIQNKDKNCFWHALAVLVHANHKLIKQIKLGRKIRYELAKELCEVCRMEWDKPVSFDEIHLVEEVLNVNIMILDIDNLPVLHTTSNIYRSLMYKNNEVKSTTQYYLLFDNDHYHSINNIKAFLAVRHFCPCCLSGFYKKEGFEKHQCCNNDNGSFRKKCKNAKIHNKIGKDLNHYLKDQDMKGGSKEIESKVQAVIKLLKDANKDIHSQENKEYIERKRIQYTNNIEHRKYIIYDYECDVHQKTHKPNHVEAETLITSKTCKYEDCLGERFSYSGYDVVDKFCNWLFTDKHSNSTIIAHNGAGYDNRFILQWCLHKNLHPDKYIRQGNRIMYMEFKKFSIRFVDSLHFFLEPLKKLSKTYSIDTLKGYFPHYFNRPSNQNYVGKIPSERMFGIKNLSTDEYNEKFKPWYEKQVEENRNDWDFKNEMIKYCRADVELLSKSVLAFRKLFKEKLDIDPWRYVTLASLCMAIFRGAFLPKKSIVANEPNKPVSKVCKEWLIHMNDDSLKQEVPVMIDKSVLNFDENRLHKNKLKVGGMFHSSLASDTTVYYPQKSHIFTCDAMNKKTKVIKEFNGCRWHGCPKCYPENVGQYNRTMERQNILEIAGYKVETMWECEWNEIKKNLPNKKELEEEARQANVKPRDALFGGRTEGFKSYVKCNKHQKIFYLDVCSLYPTVNALDDYAVGFRQYANVTVDDIKSNKFIGLVKCDVVPPKDLYVPVLPDNSDGKLLFHLNPMYEKTWSSVELRLALKKGYKITKIHSAVKYKKYTGLMKEYVGNFLKMKLENSGVKTQEECDEVNEYHKRLGFNFEIQPENTVQNPGLRQVAKICLNSLWGKFGQRSGMDDYEFYFTYNELINAFINNDKIVPQTWNIIDSGCVELRFTEDKETLVESDYISEIVAVFTTANARVRLYKMLDWLHPSQVCYCDTDSVIFLYDETNPEHKNPEVHEAPRGLEFGKGLGQWEDEFDGKDHITELVVGGAKSYAYKTANGKVVIKQKGVTLDKANDDVVHFDSMKDMILNSQPIKTQKRFQFRWDTCSKDIVTHYISKSIKSTLKEKRQLDGYDSKPFGFQN